MQLLVNLVFPLLFIGFVQHAAAQDYSDNNRLSKMSYMDLAERIICDSIGGSNLEHRICLNRSFQKADSLMNDLFTALLKEPAYQADSIQSKAIDFQKTWVIHRRHESEVASEGWRGHILGIKYLDCMLTLTELRIEELKYLLNNKY